jgi:hypothetical protein
MANMFVGLVALLWLLSGNPAAQERAHQPDPSPGSP